MSKQTKAMQKKISRLQKELAAEIEDVIRAYGKPMDMQEIIDHYPDNERKKMSDAKTLKQYISMGLGYMISQGIIKELPKTPDGRYLLELV
ncbi:MAG: hypothetical protein B5M52_00845 [Helicobacteraceae bacterium 4484_230]|nr:MAG: hypothetical protein B5M52_00845 [Helicobacteraceae bacterium 4484_230]